MTMTITDAWYAAAITAGLGPRREKSRVSDLRTLRGRGANKNPESCDNSPAGATIAREFYCPS